MKKRTVLILSLLLALAAAGLWQAGAEQRGLAEKLVRLHVIAHSDSEWDQAVKLQVRDAVLGCSRELLADCRDAVQAERLLRGALGELEEAGEGALEEAGCALPVSAVLSRERYPRRCYGNFSLPAGQYLSLRIVIGEGEGKNWWCVVFPQLCLAATAEEFREAACEAELTEEELALITEESGGVQLRLKIWEWLEGLL